MRSTSDTASSRPRDSGPHPLDFSSFFSISLSVVAGGEELFGLSVTEYPDLQRIRRELGLLQKLYSLYNSVIDNVNGYYDILWQEIDIEKINNELLEYQNR